MTFNLATGTILLSLFFITSCQRNPVDDSSKSLEGNSDIITPLTKVDSAETYILDSSVYAVMHHFFKELKGGSDSNIIQLEAIIPEFKYLNFYYNEPSESDNALTNALTLFGEGTTYFYGTKEDSTHIRKQLSENKDKLWITKNFRGIAYDSVMLASYETNEEFDWDRFKEDGYGCFESFSIPVFNTDSSKCIIQINSYCHNLLASGYSYFLEKKNGAWKIVGHKSDWMS